VIGGAGADVINLGTGTDVLKLLLASDSTASAADSVTGFGSGDLIDLTAILGAGGVGYTGLNTIHSGSSDSFFALKNATLNSSGTVATVDIYYAGATRYNINTAELKFLNIGASDFASSNVASYTVTDTGGNWLDASGDLKAVFFSAAPTGVTFTSGAKLATIAVTLKSAQSSYVFAVTGTQVNGATTNGGTDTTIIQDITDQSTANDIVPQTVVAGGTSFAITGKYTLIDDGATIGTVLDNEIHFANNSTTGGVDIRYDTDKAAGVTSASTIIHLDGITGIDLTKTDFSFI